MEFGSLYCECAMKATAMMMKNPTPGIIDQVSRIKKNNNDWAGAMVPVLKEVIKERIAKFLDDMKPIVEDPMFGWNKEQILRENLNAEANLIGIEVIKRMVA